MLPTADMYKNVFDDKPLSETQENLINWYITMVIPIVHVLSRAKNNWRPFAIVSGAYSTFVTLSDEAFTSFLIIHYRSPPTAKSIKALKINKFIKKEKQVNESRKNKNDNEEKDDNKEREDEDDDKEDENDKDNEKGDNEKDNNDNMQGVSKKKMQIHKKKVDIKQGKKDYKKWMNQLKIIKSS